MRRRKFVRDLLVAPVVTATAAAATQEANQTTKPQQQPQPQPNTPARQMPLQPQTIKKLAVTQVDLTAEGDQRFFSAEQYAALCKLAEILAPPLNGHPGAIDAHAPEFLDFLISVSPPDRQTLYTDGLNALNSATRKQFHKPFSELQAEEADAVIRPLLVVRFWPEDLPKDPVKNFMAQVHEDLRTATENSREWAAAQGASGRRQRGFTRSVGYYWKPIDPVVRD
jgi:hypothetical protein